MPEELKNVGEEYQRLSKEGFNAATRSLGEMNKGFQALAAEMTDYSKRTFEDVFRAWEQLLGARSMDRAFEIQSQYAMRTTTTLPRCRSLARCMSAWRLTRTSRSSRPPAKRLELPRSRKSLQDPGFGFGSFLCRSHLSMANVGLGAEGAVVHRGVRRSSTNAESA